MSFFNFTHRNMRLALAGALLTLAGGAIAAGCGGTDTSTLTGFCQALAAQDCSYAVVQACYASSDASLETDVGSCIGVRSAPKNCNPDNLPFHPEFGDACLAAHAAAYAGSQIDAATWAAMKDACLAVFNKGGTEGAPCKADVDCDVGNNLRCMVRVGGDGTCRIPVPAMPGDPCDNPSAQCPDGYYCDSGFNCVKEPTAGKACGDGQPCGTGFFCSEHKCVDQLPNQASCTTDAECQFGFCLGGNGGGGKCAANYVFAFNAPTCDGFTIN